MTNITFIAAGMMLCAATALSAQSLSQPKDEARIDELMSRMTLTEKIGQMNQLNGMGLSKDMRGSVRSGGVGTILNELDTDTINELQRIAVEESRLGIPLIFARDVIHGFKTIFPIPLGQAASWDPSLVEQGAQIAAREASSTGIRWTFAPMIDISRDPRWGRIAESLGEDTHLASVLGAAMVRGFQGEDMSAPDRMAACAKHFAGYAASESGRDYNTTWIPRTQLRETYLPPFKAAADAGAASFMCSFNDINGIPSSGNRWLNVDLLRGEWGYDGVLVSDWGSIEQMIPHGYSADLAHAARQAADAGVDIDMMSHAYDRHLEKLVDSGKIDIAQIDAAVRRVLRMKMRLGLFENPYVRKTADAFYRTDALAAARRAAAESAVLLKNNGVLPLAKGVKKVAVVGPLADSGRDQVGTWCFDAEPEHSVTPLKALRDEALEIIHAPGLAYSRDKSSESIAAAVKAARRADVILCFVGEEAILSGEARSRADIALPGAQTELIRQLRATGKPLVLVVMAGRPLTIGAEVAMSDATIFSFHAGTMAGPGLADVITGRVSPSGHLPVTFPRMVGQVPIYYNHKNTGRPAADITLIDDIPVDAMQTSLGFTSYHLDAGDGPLFPFGYGLSYSTFEYGPVTVSAGPNGTVTATCTVTNSGRCTASDVAQLYIRDRVASLVRPIRELRGFRKLTLDAGQSADVEFTLTPDDLGFWRADETFGPEPGEFDLWIAPDSNSGVPVTFNY